MSSRRCKGAAGTVAARWREYRDRTRIRPRTPLRCEFRRDVSAISVSDGCETHLRVLRCTNLSALARESGSSRSRRLSNTCAQIVLWTSTATVPASESTVVFSPRLPQQRVRQYPPPTGYPHETSPLAAASPSSTSERPSVRVSISYRPLEVCNTHGH